jgi:phosphohistidine phosphatase
MKIVLMRHADADADIPEGLDDKARSLTARARQTLPLHCAALKLHIGSPDIIFMSPLVRTVQTATILALSLGFEGSLKSHRALLPDGPVGALDALLAEQQGHTVVLIGHQPSMGSAAAHFLGMNGFQRPVTPGTAIGIERFPRNQSDSSNAGRFLFYASPGHPVATSF